MPARSSTPPHIATLIVVTSLSALTMNVFLPSLPRMAADFGTDYAVMQLSVSLYLAVNAALQLAIGPVSDMVGRRPVILWGIGLFLVATLGCILAPTAAIFLAFRMCQSVIVVALVVGRATIRDVHDSDQAASKIGYVTAGMAVVPMFGPAIGGLLDETLGWRASFWLLFGLGAAVLVLVAADYGETKRRSGLSLARQFRQYPELMRSPRFWGYAMSSGLNSGAFFAYLGGAPYIGKEVFGLSPAMLGIYFGTPALGYFFGNFLSGRFAMRAGINPMVLGGALICTAGLTLNMAWFAAGLGTAESFFAFMAIVGLGNGLVIPNGTAGAISVRPHLAATASGLSGALMLGLGAALSALSGALLGPGSSVWPLLSLMFATAALGLVSILAVIRRQRRLGL